MHEELQVALCSNRVGGSMRIVKGRGGQNGTSIIDGDGERKKINIGSKGVVFLFLRSGNGPSRVNSQVLQKPIWVVLVHLLLLWVCHGLIDYRVHHEGIQCALYFFFLHFVKLPMDSFLKSFFSQLFPFLLFLLMNG